MGRTPGELNNQFDSTVHEWRDGCMDGRMEGQRNRGDEETNSE